MAIFRISMKKVPAGTVRQIYTERNYLSKERYTTRNDAAPTPSVCTIAIGGVKKRYPKRSILTLMNKPQSLGTIRDVNASTWRYIVDVWGWRFFGPAILLAELGTLLVMETSSPAGLVAVLMWLMAGYGIARSKMEKCFFEGLAAELGLHYVGSGKYPEAGGSLFNRGRQRTLNHTLQGIYHDRPVRFFQYHYATGHGKNKTHHNFGVCEVTFDGLVPDITVDQNSFLRDMNLEWPHQRRLSIRKDFDEQFQVHVNEHLKIEAFEIFTPEIIAELVRPERRNYSFEFIGDKLYVMQKGQTLKRESFLALADTARFLVNALGPRLARLHDDVAAMRAATSEAEA